jgi:hypothetical protein
MKPARAAAESVRAPVVAVFEIEDATKRPKRLIVGLTDYLRVKLAESRVVKVVDKGEQEAQLKKLISAEKKNSYKTCVDESCQIPLGKELAADRILRGKLTRFGKSYVVSVELIDLASGASTGAASDKSNGTEEGLMASVERIAQTLAKNVEQTQAAAAPSAAEARPEEVEDKENAQLASAQPLPAPTAAPPPANPATAVTTHTQEAGPITGGQWAMIIGGWATFGIAYFTEIIVQLVNYDFSRAYYSIFPIVGPLLVELVSKSYVAPGPNGLPMVVNQTSPLNYVDAGVQLLGATVAVVGHVLSLNNPPVQATAAPPATGAVTTSGISVQFVFAGHLVGVSGTF